MLSSSLSRFFINNKRKNTPDTNNALIHTRKRRQKSRFLQIKQKYNPFTHTAERRFICAVPLSCRSVIPASSELPLPSCRSRGVTRLIFWHIDQMFLINNFTKLSVFGALYQSFFFSDKFQVIHCLI